MIGQSIEDRIDVGIGKQFVIGATSVWDAELSGGRLCFAQRSGCDRDDFT